MSFADFRVVKSAFVEKQRRLAMRCRYDKLLAEAKSRMENLRTELAETDKNDSRFEIARAGYNIAQDAAGWSTRDASWGTKNHEWILQSAIDQVQWIIDTCPKLIKEVRELKAQPAPADLFVRLQMQNLKVKDGNYYIEGRPVILTGMTGWPNSTLPQLRAHGFNTWSFHWQTGIIDVIKDAKGTVNTNKGNETRALLDLARDANLAAEPAVQIWRYPKEFHAEIDPSGFRRRYNREFMPYNVDSPKYRELIKTFVDIIYGAIAEHPSIASYQLMNELWYRDYKDYNRSDYLKFLEDRHGDIDTLNLRWATNFKSFAEIQHDPMNHSARYDMGTFTSHRVANWLKWLRKQIRRYDKTTPCNVKIHGGWYEVFGGQKEILNEAVDASATDSYPHPSKWKRTPRLLADVNSEMLSDFWVQTMTLDIYRSLAPNKLIIDHEYHIIPYGYRRTPAEHVYAMMWQGALHGRDATSIWLGQRRGIQRWIKYTSVDCSFLTQPWAEFAASKAGIEQERLAEQVCAFHNAKYPVALLYSGPELTKTYQALFFQDTGFDFITDKQIQDGKIGKYKLLIVPGNAIIEKKALDGIEKFLEKGGKMVWPKSALKRDYYGLSLPIQKLRKRFAKQIIEPDEKDLPKAIGEALVWAKVERPVRSNGKYIELRTLPGNDKLFYVINFFRKAQNITLTYQGKPIKKAFDLIANKPIEINGQINLAPGDVKLMHELSDDSLKLLGK
ncbi:MAG: hypothetical protein DRN81_06160 [Thermoproteota archaeon]|nr:MAG: hypothetical protein DRN81_06160 [Candidatus Korarchaeota archaeon]